MNEKGEIKNIYQGEFIPYIVKRGRIMNLLGCVLVFVPCVTLLLKGYAPLWQAVAAGVLMQLSVSAVFFVVEPVSYFTTLGIPGTYMAFLSGNISNMRVPCALVAQQAAGEQPGTEKGTMLATVGIAVSIIVNTVFLSVGVIIGARVFTMLPAAVKSSFNLLLPALFASMMANSVVNNSKYAVVGVPVAAVMTFGYKFGLLKFVDSSLQVAIVLFVSVFGTIAVCLKLFDKEEKTDGK